MEILLSLTFLICGLLANFLIKPKVASVYSMVRIFVGIALVITLSSWLILVAEIKSMIIPSALTFFLRWAEIFWHLIIGFLIGNIALKIRSNIFIDDFELKKNTRTTLWAVSFMSGNIFLIAALGKFFNMANMTAFFTSSGYAVWFLYFIIVAELLGGLGICFHFKLKTGPLAAGGLSLIMAGAVYTHWKDHDPFSDAFAAIYQLITLCLLLILYYLESYVNTRIERRDTFRSE
jgi:hypothetical protein